ncbi:hypothetical protein K469DRAFT_767254 [Zopfia rhizophila CBS 207.26]|uniref:Uncharacterized protein n=1 Tax=Zopfia rhizophila CBS 207.26 TaxID=1314779 RepID=A0A6A6E993_9PEZI|nr:hypothetical protein K469DRAFT_767254 [Zopfia rhizophila CBS 207.26]
MTFNIALPTPLKDFNNRLEDDALMRGEPDVKAWLAGFGQGTSVVDNTVSQLTYLLNEPSQLQVFDAAMLWHDDEKQTNLWYITNLIWHFSYYSPVPKNWGEYHKPIVEVLILYVERQRTREWQQDPKRQPQTLPDTFRFRL